MKNTLRKLQFIMIMLFGILFTNSANANSLEGLSITTETISCETLSILDYDLIYKDGKWKERWKSFLEGFLDGFKDGVGSINNSGSNGNNGVGLSKEDLQELNKFALKLNTKSSGLDLVYQLDQLIHDDSSVITEKQMLKVFKGNDRILDIIKKATENSTFPKRERARNINSKKLSKSKINLEARKIGVSKDVIFVDKEKSPRKFWKVLGYVVGWIAGNFIKG